MAFLASPALKQFPVWQVYGIPLGVYLGGILPLVIMSVERGHWSFGRCLVLGALGGMLTPILIVMPIVPGAALWARLQEAEMLGNYAGLAAMLALIGAVPGILTAMVFWGVGWVYEFASSLRMESK
ncbi:hypothetical protein K6118_09825 [Kordiimonas sp. A6E486]|nr:hypothetical protein [Kordiimonas marina]